jgi:hypothetical protein
MAGKRWAAPVMAMAFYCALSLECTAQEPRETNIVRQIDHLLIVSSDAKGLFSLLAETFQLPVAWPMTDYGGFASGGVALGNVNLEIIEDPEPATGTVKSRWTGFALEPEPLKISLAELEARSIRHGAPAPFRAMRPDGSFGTRWTTVALPEVSGDDIEVFICQFEEDLTSKRRRTLEQLKSHNGGPLSVQSAREIVCSTQDLKRMQENWQRLLNPLQASPRDVWQVGSGPAIRLVQADQEEIQALVVNVKSLEQARRFLKEHRLLGSERPDSLTLARSPLQGLNVILVEQPAKSQPRASAE